MVHCRLMQEKLTLAEGGIFPITYDKNGELLKSRPNTGLQIAGTIQGEGKLAGTASLFIRLASCNLRCVWQTISGELSPCDTPHASFQIDDPITMTVEEIILTIRYNIGNLNHIVISGGEPLLQAESLKVLCKEIKAQFKVHITIETNGTIFSDEVFRYVDLLSISPKLSGSNPTLEKLQRLNLESKGAFNVHARIRINKSTLGQMITLCHDYDKDIQFKFVVSSVEDETEIKMLLGDLPTFASSNVLIMPLGTNTHQLNESRNLALEMVLKNGWRYSPRLHIDIFGSKHGV